MNGYHCYVLNKEGKISGRHDIETEFDADADDRRAGQRGISRSRDLA